MSTFLPIPRIVPRGVPLPSPEAVDTVDLAHPAPLTVAFPVLLDGDLVRSPEHLGVGYLVAVLRRAGATCWVHGVEVGGRSEWQELDAITAERPRIIGLSLTTIGVEHAKRFGAAIRQRCPDSYVVAGGPLATFLGERLLHLDGWEFLDGLVRGEGEIPMLRLAEAVHTGSSLDRVPNLVRRAPDGTTVTSELTLAVHDLDTLPHPARDQFESAGGRLSPSFAYLRISTSRGCTSFCTFCNAPHARNRVQPGPVWRGRSPRAIVDEIEQLQARYGCDTFDFVDSTFEDPGGTPRAKQRVAEIATEILDRGLNVYFNCCMQAKNWHEDDRPLLQLLWRAGLEKVLIGIEAASDDDLQIWRKRSRVEDNRRALRLVQEAGIFVAFGFICFQPYSSFDSVRANHLFLRQHIGHNLRRFTTRLELYPGAEIVQRLRADGLLLSEYDTRCDCFGYRFADDRIARLAATLNRLYGETYARECTFESEPAVFQFETYDVTLHTFFSRLARQCGEQSEAAEALAQGAAAVAAVKATMAAHNYELVSRYVDAAEADELSRLDPVADAALLEELVLLRIKELQTIQLRTANSMRRYGVRLMRKVATPAGSRA